MPIQPCCPALQMTLHGSDTPSGVLKTLGICRELLKVLMSHTDNCFFYFLSKQLPKYLLNPHFSFHCATFSVYEALTTSSMQKTKGSVHLNFFFFFYLGGIQLTLSQKYNFTTHICIDYSVSWSVSRVKRDWGVMIIRNL